ncbi:hypothetical protein WA026_005734 [Henosepilachna vigintioctopunctata]|uniref:Glutathione S-transferase n=1 Tax=Henosepilachna vigintioctopunctata TaxID=420089 RepID=A0AAW1U6C3_9CUCU
MTIDLYYMGGCPPCRAVLFVVKALGVRVNLKKVNLREKEHLTPEYIKINPQHTVPTLIDDDLILSESRAIITYLANQYGKDDGLYPKDIRKRAVVDQRLYFDASTLYARYTEYYFPHYFAGAPLDPMRLNKLKDAYVVFDSILDKSKFVTGDDLTLADFSFLASVSAAEISGFDISGYPNVVRWYEHVKTVTPGYKEDEANRESFKHVILQMLQDHLKK